MKHYHYLFMAMLFFATNAQALQPKIEIFEQFDDLRMVTFISMEDINNNPEWNPDLNSPPLAVGEAIKAVKDFIKLSTNTPKKNRHIKEIEIRPVPNHKKKWHYLIKITNDAMKSKFDIYVVLMNGKVIPSIIEPRGYK